MVKRLTVLGSEVILSRCQNGEIIRSGFDAEQVEPAAYELRLAGTDSKIGDDIYTEEDFEGKAGSSIPNGIVELPPRKISVISSKEVLDIPENLCARVGIRLRFAKEGLIPLFGPQIDPGYVGRFFGIVYNASGEHVKIHESKGVFKMELQETRDSSERQDGSIDGIVDLGGHEIEHGVTDLNDLTSKFDTELDRMDAEVKSLRGKITEIEKGYLQVVLFGVFLLATTVFGVVLMFTLSSIQNNSFTAGPNFPTALIALFLVGWAVTTAAFVVRSLVSVIGDS